MNSFHTLPGWQWPSDERSDYVSEPQSHDLFEAILELDQMIEALQERLGESESH